MRKPARGPRGTAREAKREATRKRLLDAARELFAEFGYSGVSTTEIARAAGVTHGMVNAHFHSKAGLLFELIEQNNDQQRDAAACVAASEGDCLSRLRQVIDVYLAHDLRDIELFSVMQAYSWEWPYDHERRNRAQLADALAPVRDLIEEAKAGGELAPDVDAAALVEVFIAVYTRAARAAIFDDATVEEVREAIMDRMRLVYRGLGPKG